MADPADTAPTQSSMLTRALAYAAAGVPVFPCAPGGKAPITSHGFHDATTDQDLIRTWWHATPEANVAAPTGSPGFDALDVDVRANGTGWAALHRAHEAGLVHGWLRAVRTPAGGLHLHYPGTEQRNGSLRDQHVDFRGLGGYVLLPPSLIRTPEYSRRYELLEARRGPGQPLDWRLLSDLLAPTQPRRSLVLNTTGPGLDYVPRLAAHVAHQVEGNRDNALFWAACRAAEAGAPDLDPLVDAAVSSGLPEQQARRTIRSAQVTIARGIALQVPRPHPTPLTARSRASGAMTSLSPEPPIRSAS